MILNDIYFDRGEWKICRDCVYKLRWGGKSDKLKEVGYRTVSGIIELYQEE